MVVYVDTGPAATVRLEEPDDFKALKVIVAGDGDPDVVLRGVGVVEGDRVMLGIKALESLAGPRSQDPAWRAAFSAMLDYARAHGWVDDARGAVRAHIEGIGSRGDGRAAT